jgi:hypothetical protein
MQVKGVVYRPISEPAPVAELNAVWRTDNKLPLVARFQNELRLLAERRLRRGADTDSTRVDEISLI